mmetsp:Transcript_21272/g.35093  ORF Transcript_21272/g.35093 Transcript_21272/m.35093 type:complete len:101 (+) Transcript_21272:644-946(+)
MALLGVDRGPNIKDDDATIEADTDFKGPRSPNSTFTVTEVVRKNEIQHSTAQNKFHLYVSSSVHSDGVVSPMIVQQTYMVALKSCSPAESRTAVAGCLHC